jgi:hypothetical protein
MQFSSDPIIKSLKYNALTFDQLRDMVGPTESKQCRWILYDDLARFKSLEQVLELGACVILLQIETPRAPKVGHFIVLLDHGNHYEHFDSYGLSIDQELEFTKEHHLTKLFSMTHKRIVNNTMRLQTFREDTNTCGRWVVARFLLRKLELDQFIHLIKYFIREPDDLVAIMTMLLPFKK